MHITYLQYNYNYSITELIYLPVWHPIPSFPSVFTFVLKMPGRWPALMCHLPEFVFKSRLTSHIFKVATCMITVNLISPQNNRPIFPDHFQDKRRLQISNKSIFIQVIVL